LFQHRLDSTNALIIGISLRYELDTILSVATVPSNYVQVTCNSISSDGCNDWFIDPIAVNGVAGQAIGRLVYFTKRSSVNKGDYYFGLHFHLTRP
jgi:hypothetical protein